jgi:hypothetical protein
MALLTDPRCAAAMERLDLSSDSKLRLGDWGARELAKCLDVLPRLRVPNIEGYAPDDASAPDAHRELGCRGGG